MRLWCAAFAFLLAGCAHRDLPDWSHRELPGRVFIEYDCSEEAYAAGESFTAHPRYVNWRRDLGDGMNIQSNLGILEPPYSESGVTITFDDRFGGRNYVKDGVNHFEVFAEARVGHSALREWTTMGPVGSFKWSEIEKLLRSGGDLEITLQDTRGRALQSATLSRDRFTRAQETLKVMHARVQERLKDEKRLCKAVEVQELIIVGA